MPKNLGVAILRAVIAAALIVFIFVTGVRESTLDRNHMAQLTLAVSGIPKIPAKPEQAEATNVTESPVAAIKAAAKSDPGETGVYSTIWNGNKSAASVVLTVDLLPTQTIAAAAAQQSMKTLLAPSASTTSSSNYTIATLPNAKGLYSFTKATTSQPATYSQTLIYRYRNSVVALSVGGSYVIPKAETVALAEREYALLKQKLASSFSLYDHGHPVGLSVLYFIGGVAVIAFAYDGVHWIEMDRARRAEHKAALARYHYHSRGSKVLKRKAPARRR